MTSETPKAKTPGQLFYESHYGPAHGYISWEALVNTEKKRWEDFALRDKKDPNRVPEENCLDLAYEYLDEDSPNFEADAVKLARAIEDAIEKWCEENGYEDASEADEASVATEDLL